MCPRTNVPSPFFLRRLAPHYTTMSSGDRYDYRERSYRRDHDDDQEKVEEECDTSNIDLAGVDLRDLILGT